MADVLIIGGGAAGLMAADAALQAGARVMLAEAKPSLARKVLMAGKSGLNLTKDEPLEAFLTHYDAPEIRAIVRKFPPAAQLRWANSLGAETFTGSSGKVFPKAMKASPLLRAWLADLRERGLNVQTRTRWVGETPEDWRFETPEGERRLTAQAAVFALGGASWPRLGSDGAWQDKFPATALEPANMGFDVNWSDAMTPHFGAWIKNVTVEAGGRPVKGELGLTRHGIEGGAVYALGDAIAQSQKLTIDLLPRMSAADLAGKFENKEKTSLSNFLRKLGLSDAARALFFECSQNRAIGDVKALTLHVTRPRPLAEAISTRGGVRFDAVRDDLSLKAHPHVFVAGEMLNWSAPTGGYLLTASFASGYVAGQAAARAAQSA